MKLNILDAHDRFKKFTNQGFDIGECCQNLIDQRPYGDHPFYIFAHTRTEDDAATKRLIWQPRLTKPSPQTNSMLFKATPGTDVIRVIWMIPARELWGNFAKSMLTENKLISESIHDFQFNRERLEAKELDDLSEEAINRIYLEIASDANRRRSLEEAIKLTK